MDLMSLIDNINKATKVYVTKEFGNGLTINLPITKKQAKIIVTKVKDTNNTFHVTINDGKLYLR